MTIDWTLLRPHVPAGLPWIDSLKSPPFVARPEARLLTARIATTSDPVAIIGPAGSGKSSVLGHVQSDLPNEITTAPVLIDHARSFVADLASKAMVPGAVETMLSPSAPADVLAGVLFALVLQLALHPYASTSEVPATEALLADFRRLAGATPGLSIDDRIRSMARDLQTLRGAAKVVLLIDGMERLPAERIRDGLDQLLRLHRELQLVVALPSHVFYGEDAAWMMERFRVHEVLPVAVLPPGSPTAAQGRAFLREVLRTRVGDEGVSACDQILEPCITLSGGIPRTFLQLVQDAAMYARLAEREHPIQADLDLAAKDQRQSLRRLLDQGDKQELLRADGTDGTDIELRRRARLVANGLLLEYEHDGERVVHPAPMLVPLLRSKAA